VTILPSHCYGDPLDVLLKKEARSCKGCVHEGKMSWELETINYCEKGRKHGERCDHYLERTTHGA
jgi:hypothetical protein